MRPLSCLPLSQCEKLGRAEGWVIPMPVLLVIKQEKLKDSGWDLAGKSLQNSDRKICQWSGLLTPKGWRAPW